jgi:predicted glycosyltransferase
MHRYYDDIFIYGPSDFWNPLVDIELPTGLDKRLTYTGFLRRETPSATHAAIGNLPDEYILVTAGGGGDGAPLMRAALAGHAMERSHLPLLLVLGPFMRVDDRDDIHRIAANLTKVHVIDFHPQTELLLERASAVVSMAGYNTFCEVLSLDKPTLLVPRVHPRKEQLIRATRAAELGLVDTLMPEQAADPEMMSRHLRNLPDRPRPWTAGAGRMLGGLDQICEQVRGHFETIQRLDVFMPPAAE